MRRSICYSVAHHLIAPHKALCTELLIIVASSLWVSTRIRGKLPLVLPSDTMVNDGDLIDLVHSAIACSAVAINNYQFRQLQQHSTHAQLALHSYSPSLDSRTQVCEVSHHTPLTVATPSVFNIFLNISNIASPSKVKQGESTIRRTRGGAPMRLRRPREYSLERGAKAP